MVNLFTANMVYIGRVVAFLLFVASSGFTTILHVCSMEASECCDTSGAGNHHACTNAEESPPAGGTSVRNADGCHINAVAGGLSAIQALHEKESKGPNVHVLLVLMSTFVSLAPSTIASFTYSHPEVVSPPSVEKYVLNETFLI